MVESRFEKEPRKNLREKTRDFLFKLGLADRNSKGHKNRSIILTAESMDAPLVFRKIYDSSMRREPPTHEDLKRMFPSSYQGLSENDLRAKKAIDDARYERELARREQHLAEHPEPFELPDRPLFSNPIDYFNWLDEKEFAEQQTSKIQTSEK